MKKLFAILLLSLLLAACSKTDPYWERVNSDFEYKKTQLAEGNLFSIFDTEMSSEERKAMTFLYAYMTIGDITDYSGEFYLANVRSAFATRTETKWGETVPDQLFYHFVLPVRVNNESLDSARFVFHDELMPRIKDLSMYDAVLEVNHWCHEKANYQPSDARTSSPLATVKTAYGRCGEESTFLVAALRSVGIPARQVYTPRWAHTDDNHAWVEAWVDGKWYFLGACEPEPVLNLGWFNAPASRGMLMHTKVFGYYEGPEDVMKTTANYTEINVISNYADNAPVTVEVVDTTGKAIPEANIEFKLYNYAEFYTVSRKQTNAEGKARLSAGLGDMMVFASKDDRFGWKKVSFGKDSVVKVALNRHIGEVFSESFDIVPPAEKANLPEVTPEQRAENDRRFHQEDSIRNAYIATFPDSATIETFAKQTGLDAESIRPYIVGSRGNWKEIMNYLRTAAHKGYTERALQLLATLSEKDLRDTPQFILDDHLYNTDIEADAATVMAPRIGNEMLTAYRSFFKREITPEQAKRFHDFPWEVAQWCVDNITVNDELCTVNTIISPEGVWRSRVADSKSLVVFYVALSRSMGIPTWIDGVTGNVFYRFEDKDVFVRQFSHSETYETGELQLDYKPIPRLDDPEYYRHYTLSVNNGTTFDLLQYPDFEPWSKIFKKPSEVECGYYMLTSGTRLANGSVLAQISTFNVEPGKLTKSSLVMRDNTETIRVIGSFNSESRFTLAESGEETSVLLTTGRGYFVIGLLGVGQEPTDHALKDIAAKAAELEKWGRKMIFLFPDRKAYDKYCSAPIKGLPSNVVFGIDNGQTIRKAIYQDMKIHQHSPLPVFIIADTFNRVVFESHGYTIGLGNQLLKTIGSL